MSKQASNRKPLIVGIIAAVAVLAALLAVLLSQCVPGEAGLETTGDQLSGQNVDLYWNVDRAQYDGMSDGGMSSRSKNPDGYYHVRFFKDGKMVELKVADKSLMNKIEAQDLMGLVFDDDGIVVDMIHIDKMPVQKVAWKFYVQSVGGKLIKANSSNKFDGMEIVLEKGPESKVYDMTGTLGDIGCETDAVQNDRIMAVADMEGNLIAVYIYDRSNMRVEFQAYCQHCDMEVTWVEWTHEKQLPKEKNGGHFKLMNDIQLNAQQTIPSDAKICLDLNGKTVNGKEGARVLSLHNQNCEVAIMDTSEEKNGRLAAHGEIYAQGCVVWVRYGACYLYDGILDASDVVCTGRGGAAVYVPAERFFYMHGGEIIGGTAKYYWNEDKAAYANGLGGAVYNIGKFVLNDGVIRDGVAQSKAVVEKGKTSYKRGIGGNIYVGSKGLFEMNGGTIKNGRAGSAGNIFLDGTAEFILNGGTITGGRATDNGRQGGNLNIGAKATFVMNGGSITGGSTKGGSGNVYLSGTMQMNGGSISGGRIYNATTGELKENANNHNINCASGSRLEVRGGTVKGGVYAVDASADDNKRTNVVLAGGPVIYSGEEGKPNLTIALSAEPVVVKVGNLTNRAKIGITAQGIFTQKTSQANQDNFISDISGAEVLYVDECLAVGRMACLCGQQDHVGDCDGKEILWAPWTSTNGLPTASGNYFLVNDVTYTKTKGLGGTTNFIDVSLNLNGKTISSGQRAINVFGSLNLADHVGGGKIVGAGLADKKDHTGVLLVYTDSKLNIYGGTLKLADDFNDISNGGVIGIGAGAVVNLYAGTIDGRSTDTQNTVKNGGAIRVSGTLNIHGGTVYGGKATNGGAIYVEKTGCANVIGGTINGGNAEYGGAFYVTGEQAKLNVSGGVIQGGEATEGGNIRVQGYGNLEVTGGMIMNGYASNLGGNISLLSGSAAVKGGKIVGGKTFVGPASYSKKTGEPNYSKGYGGNIATKTALVISGGTVTGGQANRAGNIYVDATAEVVVSDGTITGGTAEENGGNIYVAGGKLAIKGGTIDKGTALNGGAIRIQANGTVEMSGGKIQGGIAKAGGNVSLYTGTFTMSNGQVLDGTATTNHGGNFSVAATVNPPVDESKIEKEEPKPEETKPEETKPEDTKPEETKPVPVTLTISGGTVSGGKSEAAKGAGGNIRLGKSNAVLNLSGGEITNGQVAYRGGNISGTGTINMTGGSITKGSAVGGGGNIDGSSGVLILNLSGGKITGGVHNGNTDTDRANVYLTGGELNLSGKIVIDGGVLLVDEVGCSVSGTPKVEGVNGIKLTKYNSASATKITVGELTKDAKILLNASSGVFAVPAENYTITETDMKAFVPLDASLSVGFEDVNLKLYKAHAHCWCENAEVIPEGHTCAADTEWTAIEKKNGLETVLADGGHYYLNWTGSNAQKVTVADNAETYLCLNGATIYAIKALTIGNNAELHICDCSAAQTGTITISGSSSEAVVLMATGNASKPKTVNLYSGTISGSHSNNKQLAVQMSGGYPTFNMYGGTITGGFHNDNGGNVRLTGQNGVFNMFAGTIVGGTTNGSGTNVYISKGRFNMTGGSVLNGAGVTGESVRFGGEGTMTIGGTVAIDSILVASGKKLAIKDDLTLVDTDKPINITMEASGVFAEGAEGAALTAAHAACFTTQAPNSVALKDGKLEIFVPHTHCWCEGKDIPNHTCDNNQIWTGVSATASLNSGYYYLTESKAMAITVKEDQTVYLDLNGMQIRAQDVIKLEKNATLYICDCSEGQTGEITTTKNSVIKIAEGQTVYLLDGKINGTRWDNETKATASRIAVEMTGGNFYMYGGKVLDGCCAIDKVSDATKKETEKGGSLYMTGGTATILGGELTGGKNGSASCDVILVDGQLVVGGDAKIGVVKLAKNKTMAVSAEKPLTGTKTIGIALEEAPAIGSSVAVVTGAASADAFHSINVSLNVLFENGTVKLEKDTSGLTNMELKYDDRKDVKTWLGLQNAPTSVQITQQDVKSTQVGTQTKDENVLVYEGGMLYAVGVGTATLTVDDTSYNVTVEPAKLSVFMITGTSIGVGWKGDESQSVTVEAGQAYSTFAANLDQKTDEYVAALLDPDGGLGHGSANRAGTTLDAFAPGQGGTLGEGGALALSWTQKTDEKVWIINAARGGSCILDWIPEKDQNYNDYYNCHNLAADLFLEAQQVMTNEFAAGHYTMGDMAIIYHNGHNFTKARGLFDEYYEKLYTEAQLKVWYDEMWSSYQTKFNKDLDGNGVVDTIKMGFAYYDDGRNTDQHLSYYLAATNSDMFIASTAVAGWMKDLTTFPTPNYPVQSGSVSAPDSVYSSENGGTSDNSLYCLQDKTHLSQVGYNAMGLDIADNLYKALRADRTVTSVEVQNTNMMAVESVTITEGKTWPFSLVSTPLYGGGLTIETSGNISLVEGSSWVVRSDAVGEGKLTIKNGSTVLAEVAFTVTDGHKHCFCEGAEVKPANHTCDTSIIWKPVAKSSTSATGMSDGGHYYLDWTGASPQSLVVADNAEVYLCLNGATIYAGQALTIGKNSVVHICDCSSGKTGTITASGQAIKDTYNPVINMAGGTKTVNLYSGTINGTNDAVKVQTVRMSGGTPTFNMYGGTIAGGYVNNEGDAVYGGNVRITGANAKFNMYAGTITGGESTGSGGNVFIYKGQFNMHGGKITDGKVGGKGANLYVTAVDNPVVTITGGEITGGTATTGACVRVESGTLIVGGNTKIDQISLASGKTFAVKDDLTTATPIEIDADEVGTVATAAEGSTLTQAIADRFVVKTPNTLELSNNTLVMVGPHDHCFCVNAEATPTGHTCDNTVVWTAIEKSTGAKQTLKDGDHYYLNWTDSNAQSVEVQQNAEAYLCLNGATIYATQAIQLNSGSVLHICDCSSGKTGLITVSGSASTAPINLGTETKTVYFYSGNISGNANGKKYPSVSMSGGVPTFYMYGGTIKNGYNSSGHGGNVVISGENANFYMHGGTITGGSVATGKHGGNVYMNRGRFTMYGGTITKGVAAAKGGNVMLLPTSSSDTAVFEMFNGTISGGLESGTVNAANGGNVCANATSGTARFIMHNGIITGGAATSDGGNIYIYSSTSSRTNAVTINGGSVTGGTAARGTCIYNNNGTLTIDTANATVDDVKP